MSNKVKKKSGKRAGKMSKSKKSVKKSSKRAAGSAKGRGSKKGGKRSAGAKRTQPKAVTKLTPAMISKTYGEFQKKFTESYEAAKKAKDKTSISSLERHRDAVVKKVQAYNANPENGKAFFDELTRGIKTAEGAINKEKNASRKKEEGKKKKPAAKRKSGKKKSGAKRKTSGRSYSRGPTRTSRPASVRQVSSAHNVSSARSGAKSDKHSPKEEVYVNGRHVLEKYPIEINKAKIEVEIAKEGSETKYIVNVPEINPATATLLKDVRDELITSTTISMKELVDPESFSGIKQRFMVEASDILKQRLPRISKETEDFLIGRLIQDMLGLGKIEFLINDPLLEEVVITSSKEPIKVYSKKYGWLTTNVRIEREDSIVNYSNIIARRVGRQINVLSPLLDAHLTSGDRINAVLYPINTKGNSMTIRKFARDPYTIIDLINNKTCDINIACLIWIGTEYEMNIIISGGTASGKTSFLNACMPFIPPNQRIISIEDTRELMLPEFLYWTPLVTRTPNAEGKGEVSMLHLLVNSLRMRPDRIILGEMRRHEEAMVLFEAMHTGHSVYATVHADSSAETISRLVNPPMSVPANLLRSVNLNVVMFRDRRRGIRRTFQVSEFEAASDEAKANILYRWSADEDKIIPHNESFRFFEDLSRHTGMSTPQINENLGEKKKILTWLMKHHIRSLENFGKVMNIYYRNKPLLLEAMRKDDPRVAIGDYTEKQRVSDVSKAEEKPDLKKNLVSNKTMGSPSKKSAGASRAKPSSAKTGVKTYATRPSTAQNTVQNTSQGARQTAAPGPTQASLTTGSQAQANPTVNQTAGNPATAGNQPKNAITQGQASQPVRQVNASGTNSPAASPAVNSQPGNSTQGTGLTDTNSNKSQNSGKVLKK